MMRRELTSSPGLDRGRRWSTATPLVHGMVDDPLPARRVRCDRVVAGGDPMRALLQVTSPVGPFADASLSNGPVAFRERATIVA